MDYKDIVGHDIVVQSLKRAVKNKNINHFYLFEGEEGLGKRTLGRTFAKTLLCEEKNEEPCNHCSSCRKFDHANHPDYLEVDPEKGIIRKGQVEEIIRRMSMSPFQGDRKVFLIDQAHLMNKEAQNAMLKSLEEPPSYIHMILVTSSSKNLLPTIISRGQKIRFHQIPLHLVMDYLVKKEGIDQKEAKFLGEFSKGSLGRTIELCHSEDFFELRDWILELVDSIIRGESWKIFSAVERFTQEKDRAQELLEIMMLWFRDLLVYKATEDMELVINRDKEKLLSEQTFLDFDRINDIIKKIQDTSINIQLNVNYQLSIETMLFNIQEEF
ncbi:DNA polymerase III subunit delta' [Gudongella sp. DL1XJH-153]|uniref:DNA polymerase III subunit delta' n=1 Tax=Gudongella sp. DL1XJH-153 TaxID=3409804 RepID=UPI003BB6B2B1